MNITTLNCRELSFKKGDILYIRRQIDKNWYEGEHNGAMGLLPVQYVDVSCDLFSQAYRTRHLILRYSIIIEPKHIFIYNHQIISNDGTVPVMPMRKPTEGQARAKYNFVAQSDIELSLKKGELVSLTRRVDQNWYEGRIGARKGIFPVSYVEVLLVSVIFFLHHMCESLCSWH